VKVLLVDDEQIIRKGIRTFIPWENLGCRLAGEASDGEEALALMETVRADIVLTDIRMPGMDGLELAGELGRRYPRCKVIILTGYGDFEYARQAIKYRVTDYLLKPVGEEELTDVLQKTLRALRQEVEERQSNNRLQEMVSDNLGEIRRKILEDLIHGRGEPDALRHRAEQAGLDLPVNADYQVLLLFPESAGGEPDSGGLPEIPGDFPVLPVRQEGRKGLLVLLVRRAGAEGTDCRADRFYRDLRSRDILSAAGSAAAGPGGIALSHREAQEAFSWRVYLDRPGVIHYSSREQLRDRFLRELPPPVSPGEAETFLAEQFLSLHPDTGSLTAQLLHGCLLAGQTREDYIRFCRRLYLLARKEAERKGIRIAGSEGDPFADTEGLYSWKLLLERAGTVFRQLEGQVSGHTEQHYSPLTVQAIRYIENHFKEDITLSRIAEVTGVSESHISRMFKKDTGINFIPWVNRFRVEYSRELLASPELKLYNVADLAGFSDYKYYTLQFKRYTGISPMEYRKNLLSE